MKEKEKESKELIFKIITIGNSGVGKTSIIKRYVHNSFDEQSLSTIGIGIAFKEVTLKNGKSIKLKFIDTAGQETYKALTKTYYKNTDGVLFIFSLDDRKSFVEISDWIKSFKNANNDNIPKYLIGNKSDLNEKCVEEEEIKQLKEEHDLISCFYSSAKTNTNIDPIFQELSEKLYKNFKKSGKNSQSLIILEKKKMKEHDPKCILCIPDA